MKVSIAICTWNRARLLRQTLEQICNLQWEPGVDWELIVVDNNSSDDTSAVIDAFRDRLPLKPLFESQAGHSRSRNAAVAQTTGDLIVWTDNDVLVDPNWAMAYVEAASRHPQADFFGGKIVPRFEDIQPDWLAETWTKCQPVYAARDLGDTEFCLDPGQFPFGANFAVRTSTQRKYLFNPESGRCQHSMLGDDEIGVMRRMVADGHHGIWVPTAVVQHVIPSDRATPRYVADYFLAQGRMNVRHDRATFDSPWHAWRVAWFNQICYLLKRRSAPADEWVSHLIRANIARGEWLEKPARRNHPVDREC